MVAVVSPGTVDVIDARGLCKVHPGAAGGTVVLQDIDVVVRPGEIVALRGPSGSGKSTLLHILGCLDRPTRGEYRLGGSPVTQLNREEQAWVRLYYIGFVFQSFHLLPHATALENVALPKYYAGVSRSASEQASQEMLARVGLAHRFHHYPSQLSGGERQRVAIARALSMNPRLLLADEPTGALDTKAGAEIMQLLLELHRERGTAMLLVTHDLNVASYAHRQLFLRDGRIVAEEELELGARH